MKARSLRPTNLIDDLHQRLHLGVVVRYNNRDLTRGKPTVNMFDLLGQPYKVWFSFLVGQGRIQRFKVFFRQGVAARREL